MAPRAAITEWRRDYNEVRPHSSSERTPPAPLRRSATSVVTLEAGSATPAGSHATASICLRWVRSAWAVT
ncbi:MAG: transposase [Betaproteobacteria bacterium]|nr:transposase [Betaproteobacteria bacterium]